MRSFRPKVCPLPWYCYYLSCSTRTPCTSVFNMLLAGLTFFLVRRQAAGKRRRLAGLGSRRRGNAVHALSQDWIYCDQQTCKASLQPFPMTYQCQALFGRADCTVQLCIGWVPHNHGQAFYAITFSASRPQHGIVVCKCRVFPDWWISRSVKYWSLWHCGV